MSDSSDRDFMSAGALPYLIVGLGAILTFLAGGMLTWKRTAAEDARGAVTKIQFKISDLEKDLADVDDAEARDSLREKIKELREEDMKDAQREREVEAIDAATGQWFWSMGAVLGKVIAVVGLVLVALRGNATERAGAMIAVGILLAFTIGR